MNDKKEDPVSIAIKLSRMKTESSGQQDEIHSLFTMLDGAGTIIGIVNKTILTMAQNKKSKLSKYDVELLVKSLEQMTEGLQNLIESKIFRIDRFIRYFRLFEQNVDEENKKLETLKEEYSEFNKKIHSSESYAKSMIHSKIYDFNMNELDRVKSDFLKKELPVLNQLVELENIMQNRIIDYITLLAKTNTKTNTDSNYLFKLLTDDPYEITSS